MKYSIKINNIISYLIIYICYTTNICAQGIINNGANIVITNGSNIYIDGTGGNYTSQSDGIFTNASGSVILLEGNWINNSSNTGFSSSGSTIILEGSTQSIGGTNSTTFYNLTGSGSGTCTMGLNITISNALDLAADQILFINGYTLTLGGTIGGAGKIKGSSSSNLTFNGSGTAGTVYFDLTTPGTTNKLNNFTYNRSGQTITLGNALQVVGTVTPTAGTLASGGNLTLVSTASGTASIAEGSGTYITGNVTAERYIPAGTRRFRYLSSPVSGATLNGLIDDIYITGNNGTGGFDITATNNPSAFRYDESLISGDADIGWDPFTSLSDAMTIGRGYRILIRGDRSDAGRLNGTVTNQNAVTLDQTGAINKGDITPTYMTFSNSGTASNDGWNLMGNPYPCNIDWNAIYDNSDFANVDPSVYQRDAVNGNYKSYNAVSNSGSGSQIINSFAGFFVQFTGAPSATFKESRKSATAGPSYFKSKNNELLVKFEYDSVNNDLLLIKFTNNAKGEYDRMEDSRKLPNETMNLFSKSLDNESLCSDLRDESSLNSETIIPLFVTGPKASYKLRFDGYNSFGTNILLLEDKYLNRKDTIRLNPDYPFEITEDINTKNNRFNLIFTKASVSGNGEFLKATNNFILYPNPATDIINLSLITNRDGEYYYFIYDLKGKEIKKGQLDYYRNQSKVINIESLCSGMYFIKLLNNQSAQTIKFIK